MNLEIWQGSDVTPIELSDGAVKVGGAEGDQVRIAGLPDALVELRVDGQRLTAVARLLISIDDVLFPPGVARLLVPGERVQLSPEVSLVQPKPKAAEKVAATCAVLKGLLTGEIEARADHRGATLTCLTGLDTGQVFTLALDSTDVGRGREVQLRIRDRSVSRRHFRVLRKAERYAIEDLGSPNGVYVKGKRISGKHLLESGDVIEAGHTLLRFEAPAPEPKSEPPAPPEQKPEPKKIDVIPLPPREATVFRVAKKSRRFEWLVVALGATFTVIGFFTAWALMH